MGKKLIDIKFELENSSDSFLVYLKESLGSDIFHFITEISKKTEFQIFSGVIRNFFLSQSENRDLDIVLHDEIEINDISPLTSISRNSFGGYKVKLGDFNIDLWYLKDTWAFNHQKTLNFYLELDLKSTAFFNFSAISYSFNKKKFIYSEDFVRFLKKKEIDVVFKPNANNPLCVVNTIYYSNKYDLKISKNLFIYLKYINSAVRDNNVYLDVQNKHFKKVLYSKKEIDNFLGSDEKLFPMKYRNSPTL